MGASLDKSGAPTTMKETLIGRSLMLAAKCRWCKKYLLLIGTTNNHAYVCAYCDHEAYNIWFEIQNA